MWKGECFVFDNRVTVDHNLEPGQYDQCHACRRPITEEDKQSEHFVQGVSCHFCIDEYTPEQRERFKQREKQMQLAKARGEDHLGNDLAAVIKKRKEEKLRFKNQQRNKN